MFPLIYNTVIDPLFMEALTLLFLSPSTFILSYAPTLAIPCLLATGLTGTSLQALIFHLCQPLMELTQPRCSK